MADANLSEALADEPTLADLKAALSVFLWDDANTDRNSDGVTVRTALGAGVLPQDLDAFKRAVVPKGSDETAAATLLGYLAKLVDDFPEMAVRDAVAWSMVAEQAWAMTHGAVREFTDAGLGPGSWRFMAAGLTCVEAVQMVTEAGSQMPTDLLATMIGLRGTVVPGA